MHPLKSPQYILNIFRQEKVSFYPFFFDSPFQHPAVTLKSLIEETGDNWFPLIGGMSKIRNADWRDAKVTWPVDASLFNYAL